VDPDPSSPNHNSPKVTLLGGDGGNYESVAVDNGNPLKPIFFTTEDNSSGELRRFQADGNGWDALHVGGRTTYLQFLDGNRFQWTSNLDAGMNSAATYYPNAEGIIYHNSTIYFVAKVTKRLFIPCHTLQNVQDQAWLAKVHLTLSQIRSSKVIWTNASTSTLLKTVVMLQVFTFEIEKASITQWFAVYQVASIAVMRR
jgi:hypothetical protein